MKRSDKQLWIEQVALLCTSFVWTIVVLTAIALYWAYQDVQARWEYVLSAPPDALAQAAPATPTPTPTATLWSPPPTLTPSPTRPPTPTATWVIPPPQVLPETFGPGEPTPVVIAVEPGDQSVAPTSSPPSIATQPLLPTEPTLTTPAQPAAPPPPIETPTPLPPPPLPLPQPQDTTPTRLVIESVGIDSPVIPVGWQVVEQNGRQYSIWEVADYAVGWHKTSALLGQPGNTVMAGHNNVKGEVFRDLVNIELGDQVVVYAGESRFEYIVDFKTIVKEKGEPLEVRQRNAQWIAPTSDERLTLVTCWPYTSNTHRVIVVARPL